MYNAKTKSMFVEIPRNGSRSVMRAITTHYGKSCVMLAGYHTLKEMTDLIPYLAKYMVEYMEPPVGSCDVFALLRNPFLRLHSQINHYMRNKGVTLDEAMSAAFYQEHMVFKPQHQYISPPVGGDINYNVRLFDFDNKGIATLTKAMIGTEYSFHMNKLEVELVTQDELMAHKMFDELMRSTYKRDLQLWAKIEKVWP